MEPIKVTKDSYIKDGRKYDRVTSVLDYFTPPELHSWGLRVGKAQASRVGRNAKRVGTRVHTLALQLYEGGLVKLTKHDNVEVKNCMKGLVEWWKNEKPNVVKMEEPCFSDEYSFAGTPDIVTPEIIVDIKTGNAIRPQYWLQLAAYHHLISNGIIDKLAVVRVDKMTADYEYRVIEYDEGLFNLFLGLLNYYRYCRDYKVKKEKEKIVLPTENIFAPIVKDSWTEWHREI